MSNIDIEVSEKVREHQIYWHRRHGYFESRVGDLVRKRDEERLRAEAEARAELEARAKAEQAEREAEAERALKEQIEQEREARRKELYRNGKEVSVMSTRYGHCPLKNYDG